MASINPHIHFNGNTEEAFEFYRSVLGGSFSRLMRFKELMGQAISPKQKACWYPKMDHRITSDKRYIDEP